MSDQTDVDLDLELREAQDNGYTPTTQMIVYLIQRLRKAEADAHQFQQDSFKMYDLAKLAQARIAALERVRDAAERHTVHSDRTSAADLVAALDALRLTENATSLKGKQGQ